MKQDLQNFINQIDPNHIYNEYSLQFELGCFLRKNGYDVYFEKNVRDYNINKANTYKSEIDLVVEKGNKKYAIELKYPKNGQYPEEMYQFIRDIAFTQQLLGNNNNKVFEKTYCLTVTNQKGFIYGSAGRTPRTQAIYQCFRNNLQIKIDNKSYGNPTGNATSSYTVSNIIKEKWIKKTILKKTFYYYIVENL